MIPRAVPRRQGRAGNRPGIVVKADQRRELVRCGRRIADRARDSGRVARQIRLQPRIALRLRPHRARPDALARRAPADGPGRAAGAGVGIGFDQPVGPPPGAAFEPFDERDARGRNPRRRRVHAGFARLDRRLDRRHLAPPQPPPEKAADGIEDRFALHRGTLAVAIRAAGLGRPVARRKMLSCPGEDLRRAKHCPPRGLCARPLSPPRQAAYGGKGKRQDSGRTLDKPRWEDA